VSVLVHLRRHLFFNLVQVAAIVLLVVWWRHLPFPGYAIGTLAVLAAVMSVGGDNVPRWQRALWMLLIIAFAILEFRAIHKDHTDYASAEADRRDKETKAFQRISDGLTGAINQSQLQFAATMYRFNDNLNVMTGGNSYCYFTFNLDGLPKVAQRGKYTLYDLHANFLDAKQSFIVGTEWLVGSPLTLGEVSVGGGRIISNLEKPSDLNSKDQLNLRIFFGARNGFWREEYRGRYVDGKWTEAIKVLKGKGEIVIFEKIDKQFPRGANGEVAWN
jgi:hypothetical protein